MRTIGVIGTGSMGGIMARVQAKSDCELLLSNRNQDKAQALARELGASVCGSDELAARAEYIFLCVKPQMMPQVLESINDVLAQRQDSFVLVSIAASLSVERLQHMLGASWPLIRMVPNTPAAIGEGMAVYTCSGEVSTEQEKNFLAMMAASGRLLRLEESLIDIASTVSGCGPAFVDMFIEAMADGGVACGLPRGQAMELAAQMMVGTARLLLESGKHPGQLKDAVCSPGGTTIQGVRALEAAGFRSAVIEAVIGSFRENYAL